MTTDDVFDFFEKLITSFFEVIADLPDAVVGWAIVILVLLALYAKVKG